MEKMEKPSRRRSVRIVPILTLGVMNSQPGWFATARVEKSARRAIRR